MCGTSRLVVELIVILYIAMEVCSKFEFTNIQCTSLDKEFDDIEYCYIKSVNRNYKYISLKVKLFKTPVTKIKVNGALYQRKNGYKPFLYNVTFDACQFLRKPKRNPVAKYFYELFKEHSNMNHSCPFDHDIILEKLSIDFVNTRFTEVLPFPEGDYLLETHWYAYNVNRAIVKVYGTLLKRFSIIYFCLSYEIKCSLDSKD